MNKKYLLFLSAVILIFSVSNTFFFVQADEKPLSTNSLEKLEERIASFNPDPKYRDDKAAVIALKEAVAAAREGNYGIGSCLIHEATGTVMQRGHNRVFKPYFRSDLHAEMDTLTRYEEKVKAQTAKVEGLILYTSLEPCPMCLARIITSGIKKVYYLAPDANGGMVHRYKSLPPIWQEIARGRIYESAQCSPELKDIALEVFHFSSIILDERLKKE
jgi:tRNA(adenine34) deaminase